MLLTIIWLILVVVFIIVEISTAAYISLWFILGSLIAMLSSFITSNTVIQIAVFLFVSFVTLITLRQFAMKYAKPAVKSNVEALIDKEGIVTETINNIENAGRIQVMGQDWAALSENDNIIEKGKKVVILNIKGIKLIVKEVE